MEEIQQNPKPLTEIAYIDGSSKGWYGYYWNKQTFIIKENTEMTNNQAEWMSLYALILDLPIGWTGIVYSDSFLIVNQFKGIFKLKNPELKRIHDLCKELSKEKKQTLTLVWIPREQNIIGKKLERELSKERLKRWKAKQAISSKLFI